MTVLSLTKPFETRESFLIVENQLKVGTHLFRLVVVDDDGVESDPMDATVVVRDPTTIISPIITRPVLTRPIDPIGPVVNPLLTPTPQAPMTPITRPRRGKRK